MSKQIYIRNIPDDVYYKLLEMKARYQSKDWIDFLRKLTREKDDNL